jgi:hypothetical protein
MTMKEIHISGQSQDGSYVFNDSKKFTYKPKQYFSLIETDKPAYKPGEKSKHVFTNKQLHFGQS